MIKDRRRNRQALILLWVLRCEFIEGGNKLTKKGKGLFMPSQWRFLNKIKSIFSPKWRKDMVECLSSIERQQLIREATVARNN